MASHGLTLKSSTKAAQGISLDAPGPWPHESHSLIFLYKKFIEGSGTCCFEVLRG